MKFRALTLLTLCLLSCVSCQKKSDTQLKVAASSVPHAEILEMVKPELAKEGIELSIIVIDDYQLPNRLLDEKQIDANFFQHEPFLQKEIADFGYKLKPLVRVHIEPLGIYSKHFSHLKDLPHGATIAIPSDPTNEFRALRLLEKAQMITLNPESDQYATVLNIAENPFDLKIKELDAPLLTRTLSDVDCALIPGNFALQGGLEYEQALLLEDKDSPYVNILAVRQDENRHEIELLAHHLKDQKISELIEKKFQGKIISLK